MESCSPSSVMSSSFSRYERFDSNLPCSVITVWSPAHSIRYQRFSSIDLLHLFPFLVCLVPIEEIAFQLVVQYGNVWHQSWVRKYLSSEDWPLAEYQRRPWFGLLELLRKYPEHFVINTRAKGPVTPEFVSLVSLLL